MYDIYHFAIVENDTVTDLLTWDGVSPWTLTSGIAVHIEADANVHIGDRFENGQFISSADA